jgi:adenosyl cobinamide kinase/adenosyl cobinamide phosphate guanylyltransferase
VSGGGRVTLNVEMVLRETDKALLVLVDTLEVWVPKSIIDDDSECYSQKSGPGSLIVPEWFAEREGLS